MQAVVVWAPVSGNVVLLWLNVAPVQSVVVWHVSQVVGNPTAVWEGLFVPAKSLPGGAVPPAAWQPAHVVGNVV